MGSWEVDVAWYGGGSEYGISSAYCYLCGVLMYRGRFGVSRLRKIPSQRTCASFTTVGLGFGSCWFGLQRVSGRLRSLIVA